MTLQSWIKKTGTKEVAKICGVDRNCVWQWAHFVSVPADKKKVLIVRASRGKVTYKEIIEPYLKHLGHI